MADKKSWIELLDDSLPRQDPRLYRKLRDWHVNVDDRAKRIADNLGKFAKIKGKKLLDFGCGEGGLAVYFAKQGMESWGVDISGDQLHRTMVRARENGVEVKTCKLNSKGLAEELPGGQFDFIICSDVIEHCPEPEVTLREMRRLAGKDGFIYLTTPNRLGLGWIFSDPHYNLPFVSLLPKSGGDFLAKKLRGLDNDVIHLFNNMEIEKIFSNNSLEIVYSYPDEVLGKLQNPERIASPVKKKIFNALDKTGLKSLVKPLLPAIHLFSTTLIYILRPKA